MSDDRTTELLDRALDYTIRIRDDNPAVLHAELRALSRADLEATVCVLAALVPDDRTPQQLLAWTEPLDSTPTPTVPVTDLIIPVTDLTLKQEEIAVRRGKIEQRLRFGWKTQQIARDLGLHPRVVQRDRAALRGGAA